MVHSLNKGKRFEREVANWFKARGYPARRTAQVDGMLNSDVLAIDGLHVECKHYAKIGAEKFLIQAERDAKDGDTPVVFMRQDNGRMMVMCRADDLFDMAEKLMMAGQ